MQWVKFSLRGSLANEFHTLETAFGFDKATEYVNRLLESTDEDLLRYLEGDVLVIGLKSGKGFMPPDW